MKTSLRKFTQDARQTILRSGAQRRWINYTLLAIAALFIADIAILIGKFIYYDWHLNGFSALFGFNRSHNVPHFFTAVLTILCAVFSFNLSRPHSYQPLTKLPVYFVTAVFAVLALIDLFDWQGHIVQFLRPHWPPSSFAISIIGLVMLASVISWVVYLQNIAKTTGTGFWQLITPLTNRRAVCFLCIGFVTYLLGFWFLENLGNRLRDPLVGTFDPLIAVMNSIEELLEMIGLALILQGIMYLQPRNPPR